MTSLLGIARQMRLVNLTPARLGREAWRETVRAEARRTSGATSHRTRSEPLITVEMLRRVQERERRLASPSELARAEALGDRRASVCEHCQGARFVGVQLDKSQPPVPVPCECMPLEERAAACGIDRRYRSATLESFEPRDGKRGALEWCQAWDFRGSVVMTGDVGRGKTHLGCGLLLRAIERGLPARFVSVAGLMDELKARFGDGASEQSEAYFWRVAGAHVLMLDDLGREQDTNWTRERMSTLLDTRYRTQRPTIVTTNKTLGEIADRYGPHIADRLLSWTWVEVAGASMRRELAVRA